MGATYFFLLAQSYKIRENEIGLQQESSDEPRRILIDIGAYNGYTLKKFHERSDVIFKLTGFESEVYNIYSFETDKNYNKLLDDLAEQYSPRVTLYKETAAWTKNTTVLFHTSGDGGHIKSFRNTRSKDFAVKAIDFMDWFLNSLKVTVEDTVIIKMNVEGAEFALLPDILIRGGCKFIDHIWIAFHYDFNYQPTEFLRGDMKKRSYALIELYQLCGCQVYYWGPNGYDDFKLEKNHDRFRSQK